MFIYTYNWQSDWVNSFIQMEASGSSYDLEDVWGWVAFADSNTRD